MKLSDCKKIWFWPGEGDIDLSSPIICTEGKSLNDLKSILGRGDIFINGCKLLFQLKHPSADSYVAVGLFRSNQIFTAHFEIPPGDWGKLGGLMGRRRVWRFIQLHWNRLYRDPGLTDLVTGQLRRHIHQFFEGFKHQRGVEILTLGTPPGRLTPQLDLFHLVNNGIRPCFDSYRYKPINEGVVKGERIVYDRYRGVFRPDLFGENFLKVLRLGKNLNPKMSLEWLESTPIDTISIQMYGEMCLHNLSMCKQARLLLIEDVPNHIDHAPNNIVHDIGNVIRFELMQNPFSRIEKLTISIVDWSMEQQDDLISKIATGLGENTMLTRLELISKPNLLCSTTPLKTALCDNSSISGIYKSNHTLEDVFFRDEHSTNSGIGLYGNDRELLWLQWINSRWSDKQKVIRRKIISCHLSTNFDIIQFDNLPISVFPELMARAKFGDGLSRKSFHRMYWLLRNKAELCSNLNRDYKDESSEMNCDAAD